MNCFYLLQSLRGRAIYMCEKRSKLWIVKFCWCYTWVRNSWDCELLAMNIVFSHTMAVREECKYYQLRPLRTAINFSKPW